MSERTLGERLGPKPVVFHGSGPSVYRPWPKRETKDEDFMSDRVAIAFDPLFKIDPDDASTVKPAWIIDGDGLVYLRCPHGYIIGSPSNHTIDADGTVNASIVGQHSKGACDWHVFGRLLDWIDGPIAAGVAKIAERKLESLAPAPGPAQEKTKT